MNCGVPHAPAAAVICWPQRCTIALEASQQTALRNHIELHLFAGGYAGLQLVEQNRAVLCVLLPAERLRAVGGRWDSLLDALMHECPLLGDRLAAGCALRGRPFTIAGLPYGYLHIARPRESRACFVWATRRQ